MFDTLNYVLSLAFTAHVFAVIIRLIPFCCWYYLFTFFFSNDVIFVRLAELDLSNNNFDGRSIDYFQAALGRAPLLENFTVANNPNLDLCQGNLYTHDRTLHTFHWWGNFTHKLGLKLSTRAQCASGTSYTSLTCLVNVNISFHIKWRDEQVP